MKSKVEQKKEPIVDEEGFIQVLRGSKQKGKETVSEIQTTNTFKVLNFNEEKEVKNGEGGEPSQGNG